MTKPSESDIQKIENWNKNLEGDIPIQLVLNQGPEDRALETFCDFLSGHAPRVKVTRKTDSEKKMPEIQITRRIIYSALPLEQELAPFLEALSLTRRSEPDLPPGIQETLKKITIPARLKLWVAQACPHCPAMVRSLVPLALASDQVSLHMVDGTLFPGKAAKEKVLSAPCLILDGDFRWTGQVEAGEVAEMMATRDPASLSAASLQLILEEGKASWIAEQMMDRNAIFPGFIELLLHETWSVRLGAMVVIEELTEHAPNLAGTIVPPLLNAFPGADIPVKGDILYALGEIGDEKTAREIKKLNMDGDHPDLAEALADALASIQERSSSDAAS